MPDNTNTSKDGIHALLANGQSNQEHGISYFTVTGYSRTFLNKSLPLDEVKRLNNEIGDVCDGLGIPVGKIPDSIFGRVSVYPKAVLDEVFH